MTLGNGYSVTAGGLRGFGESPDAAFEDFWATMWRQAERDVAAKLASDTPGLLHSDAIYLAMDRDIVRYREIVKAAQEAQTTALPEVEA